MEPNELRETLNLLEDRIWSVIDTLRFMSRKTNDCIDTRNERQSLMSIIDTMKEKYNNYNNQ